MKKIDVDLKKKALLSAGFSVGSAWDVVGMNSEEAKQAEQAYQRERKQKKRV